MAQQYNPNSASSCSSLVYGTSYHAIYVLCRVYHHIRRNVQAWRQPAPLADANNLLFAPNASQALGTTSRLLASRHNISNLATLIVSLL